MQKVNAIGNVTIRRELEDVTKHDLENPQDPHILRYVIESTVVVFASYVKTNVVNSGEGYCRFSGWD